MQLHRSSRPVGYVRFPEDFLWGTATAAHQVEGGNHNNDWWRWEGTPGHIRGGDRSDPACQWWAGRAEEDFARAAALGQNAHRLSIEWSRIEPRPGQWDGTAIARYRRMLMALRRHDLTPLVTLHHFTNPIWLADRGGWEMVGVVTLFERYVTRAVEALGDLVDFWCTINEPTVYALSAYGTGYWPPGKRSARLGLQVMKNLLLGHAAAYRAIHRLQPAARVGLAHHVRGVAPADARSPLDRWAASIRDWLSNRLVPEAVMSGRLRFPLGKGERVPGLAGSLDYWGINYYHVDHIAFAPLRPDLFFQRIVPAEVPPDYPIWFGRTAPEGLYRFLKRFAAYGKPIYVTENGRLDFHDEHRPRYLVEHLRAVGRAIAEGVDVRGYFYWSLVDNFEWAEGYQAPFGLIAVDFATQERRVKRSGELYGAIAQAREIHPDLVAPYLDETAGPS